MTGLERWRSELAAWAIPPDIVAAAPESPYGFPTALFRSRGERASTEETTPTTARARRMLPAGGRVLDVGCGGGATSLPLAGRAGAVVGVDSQEDMLEGFLANARAAGILAEAVAGRWPDASDRISPVDVAVSGHVLYNVADLEPFARALLAVTRVGVVLEMTQHHPLRWMNDLWARFHGIARPEGPTARDAADAVEEMGLAPTVETWEAPSRPGGFARREDAVALVRRRLCLSPDRDVEVAEALGGRLAHREGLWSAGPDRQSLTTISFAVPRAGSA